MTEAPESISPYYFASLRKQGVSERAAIDATYICVGFNIINRIADALDFSIPPTDVFMRGSWAMRRFGYRMMSGSWPGNKSRKTPLRNNDDVSQRSAFSIIDPYEDMMKPLKDAVFSGPGTLEASVRRAIGIGAEIPGALGAFVKKVAQQDYEGIDGCIADLRLAGYSDDQIFEATVSAAVGDGDRRLQLALDALRENVAYQAA